MLFCILNKIHMRHTSVCLIFIYRHTNPFLCHNHHHHWRIFISAHENAINGNQKKWTNPKCETAFFSIVSSHVSLLSGRLWYQKPQACPFFTWTSLNTVHVVNCVLSSALGCVSHGCPRCVIHSKPKIQLEFSRRKGKANDGTQMQKSFGYIFDALPLWIAHSRFLFHIGLVYRAAIYLIFSQA